MAGSKLLRSSDGDLLSQVARLLLVADDELGGTSLAGKLSTSTKNDLDEAYRQGIESAAEMHSQLDRCRELLRTHALQGEDTEKVLDAFCMHLTQIADVNPRMWRKTLLKGKRAQLEQCAREMKGACFASFAASLSELLTHFYTLLEDLARQRPATPEDHTFLMDETMRLFSLDWSHDGFACC